MPLLYTKYIGLSAGLGLAFILLPAVRLRPSLWAGAGLAAVLGAANLIVWGEEGAFTGSAFMHHTHNFGVNGGILPRYWRPLFDRHHGIVPFQPFIFLFLWPMVQYLRRPRGEESEKQAVLAGAAVAILSYTVIHGIWTGSPGASVPGRYLTAALPMMCGLIAVWVAQADRWRPVRQGLVAVGAAVAIAFYVAAMIKNLPPYYVLWSFTYLFPRYWDSWDAVSKLEMRGVMVRDIAIPLLLLAGTKAVAWAVDRREFLIAVVRSERAGP
jgi:peptidoglycan/LPS O-acetylase OafA/YrhL